jgi:phosphoribosylformimino-5-aminoimidazole carboxamide ribotide isomerase
VDLIPAIDLLDGAVVRLRRGDYDEVTTYAEDPVSILVGWRRAGVGLAHVVDLDAARGYPRDTETIGRLVEAGIPVQVGGGIRTSGDAESAVAAGAERVVVGSAFTDPDGAAEEIAERIGPERVVAALDVRAGRARGSGWLDEGAALPWVVERIRAAGVPRALVTGIERDGTLEGPDVDLLAEVRTIAPGLGLIASGGVGTLADLRRLARLDLGIEGAIVGRALHDGRFTIDDALVATGA